VCFDKLRFSGKEKQTKIKTVIRGINLIPLEKYKEKGQTYPPNKNN